jgi:hypothetical protein
MTKPETSTTRIAITIDTTRELKNAVVESDGNIIAGTVRATTPPEIVEVIFGKYSFSYTYGDEKFACRCEGKEMCLSHPAEAAEDITAICRAVDELRTQMTCFDDETAMEIVSKYAKMSRRQIRDLMHNSVYEVIEEIPVESLPLREQAVVEAWSEAIAEAREKHTNNTFPTKEMIDAKIARKIH